MSSVDQWASFALATLVFAAVPGPAMLYITAQTLAYGRRAAMEAVLGVHFGCYAHVFAAAIGLSATFHHIPELYTAVRISGAAYLIWLGAALMYRQSTGKIFTLATGTAPRRIFRQSVVVEVLNPKTAIFFMAFLPQFVDATASSPIWLQFLILGAIINLAVSSAEFAAAIVASTALGKLRGSNPHPRLVQRLCGSILVGLGILLAFRPG